MTANVNIEIARATNVLRVPNAALRFRPTNEMYAALGQTPPPPGQRGELSGGGTGRGGTGHSGNQTAPTVGAPQPKAPSTTPASPSPAPESGRSGGAAGPATGRGNRGSNPDTPVSGGGPGAPVSTPGNGSGGEGGEAPAGRGRFAERTQNLSPEERQRMLERLRARGFDPSAGGARNSEAAAAPRGRGTAPAQAATPAAARKTTATTIDALFGPLPRPESVGRVWRYLNNQLKPMRVRLGITDGQATELLEGDLHEGDEVVTNVKTGTETATRPAPGAGFPFGQPGRGGFGGQGGFGGPGGGNRGGGR
jgi:hypothetical protein